MKTQKIILIITLLLTSWISQADVFIVDRFEDAPDSIPGNGICQGVNMVGAVCSLRAAIMEANITIGDDTIFVPHNGVFELSQLGEDEDSAQTGDLDIIGDITLVNLANGFEIDGNGTDRIFHVMGGSQLTLVNGKLTNGIANTENTFQGGAIKVNDNGVLILNNVELFNNVANRGGAIFNDGDVVIEDSHLHHNAVTSENEPVNLPSEGDAILNRSIMIIGSSTLSNNGYLLSNEQNITINPQEYAIHINPNGVNAPQPVTHIFNSTLSDNKYSGIFSNRGITDINQSTIANHDTRGMRFLRHPDYAGELQLTINASLFVNNGFKDCNDLWAVPADEMDILGNFNASTDDSCGFTGDDNLENIENPLNGSLHNWGGLTPTLMLNDESPVVDFVEDNCSMTDQRGSERPLDGSNSGLLNCDVGSVEIDRTQDPIASDVIFKNSFGPLL